MGFILPLGFTIIMVIGHVFLSQLDNLTDTLSFPGVSGGQFLCIFLLCGGLYFLLSAVPYAYSRWGYLSFL